MEFEYTITYSDTRLKKFINTTTIKTANVNLWSINFESSNKPFVKVLDYKLNLNRSVLK